MAKEVKNHLFRSVKVYESTEWFADNRKNYRTVFDESECSYVYVELSLFNLKFKKEDWFLRLRLVCLDSRKNELCNLNCDRNVSRHQNVVFVREGWGTKTNGGFWKKGVYKWEAWIDDDLVAEKHFYVQDFGVAANNGNPYFEPVSLRLYEGSDSNVIEDQRHYLKNFSLKDTRFVWAEFTAKNLIENATYWTCEVSFNFRNHNNLLKGSIGKTFFVYQHDDEFKISLGWGAAKPGTWMKGEYYLDILFMDQLIASRKFLITDDFSDEDNNTKQLNIWKPGRPSEQVATQETKELKKVEINEESLNGIMKELDALIGLNEVKDRIREYSKYLNFISLRKDKGASEAEKINLHAVFLGNPGTGKTTVARMLGKIYKNLGLLSKGHVIEADRTDLVAEYIGQTAPKTKAVIEKAKGGVLFIDEAYALSRKDDDAKDFGKEAIEILLKELSDGDDIAVIAAGYPDEMNNFLESNPGLKSRFTMNYEFPDYMPQDLIQIADYAARKRSIQLEPEARDLLYKKLVEAYRERDRFFGNARLVNSLIEESKMHLGIRVMETPNPEKMSIDELSLVRVVDIERLSIKKGKVTADIPIDEELLKESTDKLERMMGLETVKSEINELIKLVRFYKETGKDVASAFSLHSVFTGNPGTGKTTVARILAQIYKALGIIERGHLIECDRQSMVGGYIGQTAIKTGEIVDKSMGGVLFIDEAYSLTEGGGSDYGKEAIEILLKRMEDHRGDFIVIAAGYTQNMQRFLESNPGLKSRFDRVFHFDDFNPSELFEIAINQLQENNLKADKKAKETLHSMLENLHQNKDKYFGNGRAIRKVIEEAVRNQHLRMSEIPADKRTARMISTLTTKDLEGIEVLATARKATSGIGFR